MLKLGDDIKYEIDLDPIFDEGEHQLVNYPRKAWSKFVNAGEWNASCLVIRPR